MVYRWEAAHVYSDMLLHWPVSMVTYNTSWFLKCPWQIAIQQQSWIKAWRGLHILSWVVHNPYGVSSVYYLWVIISLRPQQQRAASYSRVQSTVFIINMLFLPRFSSMSSSEGKLKISTPHILWAKKPEKSFSSWIVNKNNNWLQSWRCCGFNLTGIKLTDLSTFLWKCPHVTILKSRLWWIESFIYISSSTTVNIKQVQALRVTVNTWKLKPEPLHSSSVCCFTMSDNTHVGVRTSCRRATLFTGRRSDVLNWKTQTAQTDPCWQGEACLWSLSALVHISSLSYFCLHASRPACLCVHCPFMRCSAGLLRPPHCPIWSLQGRITTGYVPRVATTKRDLVFQNKKNKLCYVTHWCCCCFWWWLRAGERQRRWGGTRTRWQAGRDPSGMAELRRLYCPRTAPTPFLYLVYSSLSLTPRPTAQQHDITDWRRNKTPLSSSPPYQISLMSRRACIPGLVTAAGFDLCSRLTFCLPLLTVCRVWLTGHALNGLLLTFSLWLCLLYFQFMLTHSSHCVFVCSLDKKQWRDMRSIKKQSSWCVSWLNKAQHIVHNFT